MAMLEAKPAYLQQMAKLPEIGERKLNLYGEQFLAVINEFSDAGSVATNTINTSLELFRLGYSVEKIARQRALQEVVDLPDHDIKRIEDAILALSEDQKSSFKPVYELFSGVYSYGVLRCVRAALQFQTA